MKDKILIVISDYYKDIANMLLQGATKRIIEANFDFDTIYVAVSYTHLTLPTICSV